MSQKRHAFPPATVLLVALVYCGSLSCSDQDDPVTNPEEVIGKGDTEAATKPATATKTTPENQSRAPRKQGAAGEPSVRFRRDRDMVVARVNGQDMKLEDIIRHIDNHSYKGYLALAEGGYLDNTLSSPKLPTWSRQFADRRALELMAQKQELAPGLVDKERQRLAVEGFGEFLKEYKQSYRLSQGKDYPEDPRSIATLRRRYLLDNGLKLECDAFLNVLVPDKLTQEQADWYYRTNPQIWNGYLDISVITVHNRDPQTGALYKGSDKTKVTSKVLDIQKRLEEDGGNFEKVAARFSDVAKERARSGEFGNISRFDPRLPAAICRVAWGLRNGKWKGPVESSFGLHFVKRVRYLVKNMVVRIDSKRPEVRKYIRRLRQENMIFDARREQKVELVY
jgi:PPIC-type PPIASE domain